MLPDKQKENKQQRREGKTEEKNKTKISERERERLRDNEEGGERIDGWMDVISHPSRLIGVATRGRETLFNQRSKQLSTGRVNAFVADVLSV